MTCLLIAVGYGVVRFISSLGYVSVAPAAAVSGWDVMVIISGGTVAIVAGGG